MKKFSEFIRKKNITESNGFSRTPQIKLKTNFPTPEEIEQEQEEQEGKKIKENPKPISTEDMLRQKLEASEKEIRGLQSVINHLKNKAPLERESAIKDELKKISDFINLEFGAISKFMNSSQAENMPVNVKSSWRIFEKEMKRIFEPHLD